MTDTKMGAALVLHDDQYPYLKGINVRESYEYVLDLVNEANEKGLVKLLEFHRDSGLRIAVRRDQIVQVSDRRHNQTVE